jgi:hypothetical protein
MNFRRCLVDLSAGTSNPRLPSLVFGTTYASHSPHRVAQHGPSEITQKLSGIVFGASKFVSRLVV